MRVALEPGIDFDAKTRLLSLSSLAMQGRRT